MYKDTVTSSSISFLSKYQMPETLQLDISAFSWIADVGNSWCDSGLFSEDKRLYARSSLLFRWRKFVEIVSIEANSWFRNLNILISNHRLALYQLLAVSKNPALIQICFTEWTFNNQSSASPSLVCNMAFSSVLRSEKKIEVTIVAMNFLF